MVLLFYLPPVDYRSVCVCHCVSMYQTGCLSCHARLRVVLSLAVWLVTGLSSVAACSTCQLSMVHGLLPTLASVAGTCRVLCVWLAVSTVRKAATVFCFFGVYPSPRQSVDAERDLMPVVCVTQLCSVFILVRLFVCFLDAQIYLHLHDHPVIDDGQDMKANAGTC